MKIATYNYKRVYVWELAVRFFHWLTVLSLTVLVITGFIIANPPSLNLNVEATNSFWFGYIRLIHFAFAYILIANLVFRIYWAFAGNQFANWRNFIPYTKKHWQNIFYVLKVDIFLQKDKEHKLENISVGHNALAAFSYFIMTLFFLLQVITGLALISDTSGWWFPKMFHWVITLFGGDISTRYFHHILTWIFMAFVVIHVYLVLYPLCQLVVKVAVTAKFYIFAIGMQCIITTKKTADAILIHDAALCECINRNNLGSYAF